jgi:thymidylate synthase
MYISHDTLDDVMHDVLERLLKEEQLFHATRGPFKELFGFCFHLKNPRARLSRSEGKGKIFSAVGEFLWYLSGDTKLDFISYYVPKEYPKESDDGIRVRSGYGDRLLNWRGIDQLNNVISLLKRKSSSRRAVIQLFDASDLVEDYASIPCTCTLQFLIRGEALHLFTAMRSNDAYLGLPHDVFAFTMLQEVVARSTDCDIGEYKHCAGSLHLYEEHFSAASAYLAEGFQSQIAMEPMPEGNPWDSIRPLQSIEQSLREGRSVDLDAFSLNPYWCDIARLLQGYRASKDHNAEELKRLKAAMQSSVYKMFIQARLDKLSDRTSHTEEVTS